MPRNGNSGANRPLSYFPYWSRLKNWRALTSFLFLSLLVGFAQFLAAQPQGFTGGVLVFEDEFDGTEVNTDNWTLLTGDGTDFGLPAGWGNNELQFYKPENATVANGFLTITAKEESVEGYDYTSARMISENKQDFKYGRFEMRAKMPIGQGIWPAYWMFFTGPGEYGGWAASGEIDIMEYIGSDPNRVFGTIHYGQPAPNNLNTSIDYFLPSGTFNDDFHTFAMEWEPGEIRWYVDNELYATQTIWWSNGGPYPAPFDQDFHLLLNLAVGGNLPGNPDASTVFPQEYIVDYVRVYQSTDIPTVDLSVSNTTPAPGADLTITADPSAPLGISKVEYFQGEFKLGETTAAPHEITVANVAEGQYRLRAKITDEAGKINYSDFIDVSVGSSTQGPYSMRPVPIPGVVEAEFYDVGGQDVAYNDSAPELNSGSRFAGNIFRSDEGVDLEATADEGGGLNVGFTEVGEFLEYTIEVAETGSYNIDLRVASLNSTGPIRLEFDGADRTGPVSFEATGGFQTWADVRIPNVPLDAGVQVMRVRFEGVAVNLNKITISEAGAPTEVVFDDMEHGDPFANGWFAFGGAVGGGGLNPNSADLPPENGGNFSLETGWGSGGTPGFFGGFGRTNPVDLSGANFFNLWINPNADQDYLLEINLQEDDNGDGAIVNADDDEFQYNLTVGPPGSGAEVVSGGGWQLVSIPFSAFFDDNSFLFGGNGVLDPVSTENGGNGQLINVVVAVISNSGADVNFRTDFWTFTTSATGPNLAVNPPANDFGTVSVRSCAAQEFLLANSGNEDLVITSISLVGPNSGDFEIISGGSPATLEPGASQSVEVRFNPMAVGPRAAFLRIESNDPGSSVLDVPLTGVGEDSDILIYDDFEHGNPLGNGWFFFGGAVGGGGIAPNTGDLPPVNGGTFSLETGWGSGGTPGFFGGFGRNFPIEVVNYNFFNLWINPDAGQDFVLEFNFQEDDNADGSLDPPNDDEFQYNLTVGPPDSGAEVISGGGWQLVTIPLSALFDDNSFLTGGNGLFDPTLGACGGNGELLSLIVAVVSNSGADASFRTDYWYFSDEPPMPDIAAAPSPADFGSVVVDGCNEQAVSVTNTGGGMLTINALNLQGADVGEFSIVNGDVPFTLGPGASRDIAIVFTPSSMGTKNATLIIESSDADESPLEVPLTGEGGDLQTLIFDDMDHGNPFANGWFAFGGAVGGGGLAPNGGDLPPENGGTFSLQTGWGSGGVPGFFGGFGRNFPADLTGYNFFNLWINPDAGQDYILEINFQEDDNADGRIDPPNDDEFQYNLTVGPPDSGAEVISGGGWQLVSIPLIELFDDNGFLFGGNGLFDPKAGGCGGNGQLLTMVVAVFSNSGADVTFRTDFWTFSENALAPQPPMASLTANPSTTTERSVVAFDATGSMDTDGSIVSYDFDFGDGTTESNATGTATNAYDAPGTYVASVTVTDNDGLTATATTTVTVEAFDGNRIEGFQLVDAARNVLDADLADGDMINLNQTGDINFNIQAIADPAVVGSVVLELTGPKNATRTESVIPYELFGNGSARLPAGSYTLTATPYTQRGGNGEAGLPLSIQFEVIIDIAVEQFALLDQAGNTLIADLQDGAVIDLNSIGDQPLNIQALTTPNMIAGGVAFDLSGPISLQRTEIEEPYTVFSFPMALEPGAYTLTATPIRQLNSTEDPGTPLTINFSVSADVTIQQFDLLDADDNVLIANLQDGAVIDLNTFGNIPINIEAVADPNVVGSVAFDLSGPVSSNLVEILPPYLVFDGQPTPLAAGSYALVATPISQTGIQGTPKTIQFTVTGITPDPLVLTLVDADRNVLIPSLEEGSVVNLADYPSATRFNIQAILEDERTASVVFALTGVQPSNRTENFEPFELYGNGSRSLAAGAYTLTATVYDQSGGNGDIIAAKTINFEVVDAPARLGTNFGISQPAGNPIGEQVTLAVFPNPFANQTTIQFELPESAVTSLRLFNLQGQLVTELDNGLLGAGFHQRQLDATNLPDGVYQLRLTTNEATLVKQLILQR